MFVEVTGEKLVGEGVFLPPILNRAKHDSCIVKLKLIRINLIILTTLKNFTTRDCYYFFFQYWKTYSLVANRRGVGIIRGFGIFSKY